MSKVVVLDPGHGGRDSGAIGHGRKEKDDVLKLALKVKDLLTKQGIKVLMTRDSDKYVELKSRPQFAKNAGADALVSIHRNAHNTSANGTEIWIHPYAKTSQTLATAILERLAKTGVQSNRGIKKGSYVVLGSTVPSVMIELGFITNLVDNQMFDRLFNQYAVDIAVGICEYLGVPYNNQQAKPLYRVQLGAFANETNARRFMEDAKAQGLEAYLVIPSTEKVEKA